MYKKTKNPDGTDNTSVVLKYKDKAGNNIIVLSIPVDPDNRDYNQYLKWVADGNTIQEAD